jgi:hypothetical protein
MRGGFLLSVSIFFSALTSLAQPVAFSGQINIQAKMWSRDSARNIQYSDWKTFPSHTVEMVQGYTPVRQKDFSKYGGDLSVKVHATGFFRTQKINSRWMVIDPDGYPFIVTAVNSIRRGKSPNNEKAFAGKFGTTEKWMASTIQALQQSGFNTAGSWSETDMIIQYNKTAERPFAYTTQLNLLSGYAREAIRKDSGRKGSSILSFVLDEGFATYCNEQAKKLIAGKNDANLLGHFSDNELAFMYTEFKNIISIKNKSDKCYQAAQQWMKKEGLTEATITREQKEAFIGWLAGKYYKTVSKAIKKYDPNHLYIGSRLHSSAKHNPFLFKSAEPFVDIISINYYGYWQPQPKHMEDWAQWSSKPFFITEYYTKAEDAGMTNMSGAGWLVKTQTDRGIHFQNFGIELLQAKNCVGWHWFRYQDNDPADLTADPSNNDSNKGIMNTEYTVYEALKLAMQELNFNKYQLIFYFDKLRK